MSSLLSMLFYFDSYSWDDGETWQNFKFSNVKTRVYGLLTEPGEKTTIFTIFGSYTTRHSWFTIQVDMKDVLGKITFLSNIYILFVVLQMRRSMLSAR